ncbi:hypothetical protein C5167_023810, partial [Papaver somniferum]
GFVVRFPFVNTEAELHCESTQIKSVSHAHDFQVRTSSRLLPESLDWHLIAVKHKCRWLEMEISQFGGWGTTKIDQAHLGATSVSWAPVTAPGALVGSDLLVPVQKLVPGGCDDTVKVWKLYNGTWKMDCFLSLQMFKDWVRDVSWVSNLGLPKSTVASASAGWNCYYTDCRRSVGRQRSDLLVPVQKLVSGGCDNTVKVWKLYNGTWKMDCFLACQMCKDWVRDVFWVSNLGLPKSTVASALAGWICYYTDCRKEGDLWEGKYNNVTFSKEAVVGEWQQCRLRNHDFMPLWIIGILRIEDFAAILLQFCVAYTIGSLPVFLIQIRVRSSFSLLSCCRKASFQACDFSMGFQNQLLQVLPQDGTVIIWTVAKEGDLWEAKVLKDFNTSLTGNILDVADGNNNVTFSKEAVGGEWQQVRTVDP